MAYGLLLNVFYISTIHAAISPCSDEFSATKCSNIQTDRICQQAFPNNEAFPTINARCMNAKSHIVEECRKQCRSCCHHPDFMCADKKNSVLNCRMIAEKGQCTTVDIVFKAILAIECAGSCGLCRYAGCMDNNYLLCSMLQKLYIQYPGWVYNNETNAYYKFINEISRSENISAVRYERMCAEENAHLVSIHSEMENLFVYELANCERIFIGLRGQTSDQLEWLDGSKILVSRKVVQYAKDYLKVYAR
ncbi:hypothetical protein DINM_004076 [Dirofilaria immitis]|nr:hypothetical protein [Dirofilaria immitis]